MRFSSRLLEALAPVPSLGHPWRLGPCRYGAGVACGAGMTLAVFGGTGPVGQALVQQALAANHTVTALVRSPEKIAGFSDPVRIIVGDCFDAGARAV